MTSEDQKASRRGPAVLLALFIAVLLGAPVPAASLADAHPAGIKQVQLAKSTAAARVHRRVGEDQADPTHAPPLWLGNAPRVETRRLSGRPAGVIGAAPGLWRAEARFTPYQARAPPAA